MRRSAIIWLVVSLLIRAECAHAKATGYQHANDHNAIMLRIVPGPLRSGLNLVIRNCANASLCIPERSLQADSGSLIAFKGSAIFASQRNAEYSPGYPKAGLYYVAPKHSTSTFTLEEGGLKLAPGAYTFRVHVAWMRCSDVSAVGNYTKGQFVTRTVRQTLNYLPFR
jgi:hypothetical protein